MSYAKTWQHLYRLDLWNVAVSSGRFIYMVSSITIDSTTFTRRYDTPRLIVLRFFLSLKKMPRIQLYSISVRKSRMSNHKVDINKTTLWDHIKKRMPRVEDSLSTTKPTLRDHPNSCPNDRNYTTGLWNLAFTYIIVTAPTVILASSAPMVITSLSVKIRANAYRNQSLNDSSWSTSSCCDVLATVPVIYI